MNGCSSIGIRTRNAAQSTCRFRSEFEVASKAKHKDASKVEQHPSREDFGHKIGCLFEPAPNGSLGEIWFNIPSNGNWSDLTATFTVHRTEGKLVIALNEVHVL